MQAIFSKCNNKSENTIKDSKNADHRKRNQKWTTHTKEQKKIRSLMVTWARSSSRQLAIKKKYNMLFLILKVILKWKRLIKNSQIRRQIQSV